MANLKTKSQGRTTKVTYKKEYAKVFFELCVQGKLLTQIAVQMGIPKRYLLKWSKEPRRWEFMTAFEKGMEACQAYHEDLYDKMITGLVKCDSASKQQQRDRLRVQFKDDWSDNKQEIKIESTYEKMSDQDLESQLEKMTSNPVTRNLLQKLMDENAAPKFKIVGRNNED